MDKRAIIKYCKELGCCDACCIRYLGHRSPAAFENPQEFLKKLLGPEGDRSTEPKPTEQTSTDVTTTKLNQVDTENGENKKENCESVSKSEVQADITAKQEQNDSNNDETAPEIDGKIEENLGNGVKDDKNGIEGCKIDENVIENEGTPAKRVKRSEVCFSCIGILQEESWPLAVRMAQRVMEEKGYECTRFACALSGPISTAYREKVVALGLGAGAPPPTPLKEAWKWAFCAGPLAAALRRRLDSGARAPLLLTFHMDYTHDKDELRQVSSYAGGGRRIGNRRELDSCLASLRAAPAGVTPPVTPARCRRVHAERDPIYLGGRYIKLSRSLPQTPWVVGGARMLPSSVQEVIVAPLARLYGVPPGGERLKLLAAGREDVDVRCLGGGRPFAIEIVDPAFTPTPQQLSAVCEEISGDPTGGVKVHELRLVDKSQLVELKRGEETKLKRYEALCVKLRHTQEDIAAGATPSSPVAVTAADLARLNALTAHAPAEVKQRTPLRVLHRRPLHTRTRRLLEVRAYPVPGEERLVRVCATAEAGTYIKEWVHGDAGRSAPALRDLVPLDVLALDVTAVLLDWPPPPT